MGFDHYFIARSQGTDLQDANQAAIIKRASQKLNTLMTVWPNFPVAPVTAYFILAIPFQIIIWTTKLSCLIDVTKDWRGLQKF